MICDTTGDTCKQPESCETGGCFADKCRSVGFRDVTRRTGMIAADSREMIETSDTIPYVPKARRIHEKTFVPKKKFKFDTEGMHDAGHLKGLNL